MQLFPFLYSTVLKIRPVTIVTIYEKKITFDHVRQKNMIEYVFVSRANYEENYDWLYVSLYVSHVLIWNESSSLPTSAGGLWKSHN